MLRPHKIVSRQRRSSFFCNRFPLITTAKTVTHGPGLKCYPWSRLHTPPPRFFHSPKTCGDPSPRRFIPANFRRDPSRLRNPHANFCGDPPRPNNLPAAAPPRGVASELPSMVLTPRPLAPMFCKRGTFSRRGRHPPEYISCPSYTTSRQYVAYVVSPARGSPRLLCFPYGTHMPCNKKFTSFRSCCMTLQP